MKNILLIIIFTLPLLIGACQKESTVDTSNSVKITATDASSSTLKTAFIYPTVNWLSGVDHIGLYSDKAYTTAPNVFATNVDFVAVDNNVPTSTFTSTTTVNWNGTTDVHNFYAYYPRPIGTATPPITAVPISILAAQIQTSGGTTDHIGALDFEVASPVPLNGIPGNNPLVGFTFNHVFSVLDLTVTLPANRYVTSIVLTSTGGNIAFTNGTIDITQATPTGTASYNISSAIETNVITTTLTNKAVGPTVHVYMVVLPGTYSGSFVVHTANNGGNAPAQTTTSRPVSTLVRGKVYSVALTGA